MLILLRAAPKVNGKPLLTPAESPSLTTMWYDSSSFISTKKKLTNSAAVKVVDKMIGPVFITPDLNPSTAVTFFTTSSFVTRATSLSGAAKVSGLASYNFSGLGYYQPALKASTQKVNLFVADASVKQAVGASGYSVGLFVRGSTTEPAVSFTGDGWNVIFMSYKDETTFTNTSAQPVSFSVS